MTDCIFPKRLNRLEMLCELSSVAEATDGGLKLLLGLLVKMNSVAVAAAAADKSVAHM